MMEFFKHVFSTLANKTTDGADKAVRVTKDAFEYGKLVRRLVLVFVSAVWVWLLGACVTQYVATGALDSNFTHLVISVTGVAGACYSFYFTGRTKEVSNTHHYNNQTNYADSEMDMRFEEVDV